FLYEIQQNASSNKMSVENLATVFGVNLIRPKVEDPATIMRGTHHIQKVMTVMISDHITLFPVSKDVVPSLPLQKNDSKKASVPRSSVGWGAVERPLSSRGNRTQWQTVSVQQDDLNDSSCELNCNSDPSEEGYEELQPKDLLEICMSQSRKRTQTLPNRKYFVHVPSIRGEQSELFSSDFWSPSSVVQSNPVSSVGTHKRTLSESVSKLLTLPQFLNSDSFSSSLETTGKQTHENSLAVSADTSQKDLVTDPGQNGDTVSKPSAEDEDSPPEEDLEFLRKMVIELKREIEIQKKGYEERINSLEKENYEVWAKVVRLNEEIEKEKNKSADLERKLQDIECSRDDTENKNKLLEQEILDSMKSMK
ncbi:rho GTPase-activating protein 25-like, partial [Sphaerodactylus townsendi]|uniref:rho GTPase-activating protein 25-like n=1 Tax=Sphaerodactylus townsendi TaxID=933632 RepID=UPI002025F905